ncbi:hypothetical protein NEUTE1DRAFT_121436 [Neurospora tetrasperma FGSC 2508]|uniref:Extracellular membrane protein CFEM domain-containing protein n=1 Tax=Neurospora tetrasperma (strain FGSC 2508 / ATCC MYA-4615 / P0657) TaxID=510951 RepID=F8MHS0_NEUT8|nr:uncharacterized protein NEUTE1DRAFT_121436 [Neurospora tetrasperma FGSC 2508]EGO59681.1 hypothetical protein NEUTE1DRAFT_121436 [Neurospora tetrasperma FGSC 2508]EGZ73818.1 hypothetical protein NEUTE2DRAFT_108793 [Neurospora tetrasperma FGSC 2509]
MLGLHRLSILPPALIALVLTSIPCAAVNIDFFDYPVDAYDCLNQASTTSNCAVGAPAEATSCFCNNGGNFVTGTARCLAESDPGDFAEVYGTLVSKCAANQTPLNVGEEQYYSAAGFTGTARSTKAIVTKASTTDSTLISAPTSLMTSTSPTGATVKTEPEETATFGSHAKSSRAEDGRVNKDDGLSTGAKAGIIAGSTVAGVAVLASLVMLLVRYRRKRGREDSHPMILEQHGNMLLIPSPAEARALEEGNTSENSGDWSDKSKWRPSSNPTDQRKSGFNWESPYDLVYIGDEPEPEPPKEAREMKEQGRAELQGCDRQPVEMSTQALSPKWSVSNDAAQRYSGTEWGAADLAGETTALSQSRGERS